MWNIFIMSSGERENSNSSNLTSASIEAICQLNSNIVSGFTRYSNWIWVNSSNEAKLTGFFLKKQMTVSGKIVDYFTEPLLDTEEGLYEFIEKLKQISCKNNVVIVSDKICKQMVKILNNGKAVDNREYYHFKCDGFRKCFTLCNK